VKSLNPRFSAGRFEEVHATSSRCKLAAFAHSRAGEADAALRAAGGGRAEGGERRGEGGVGELCERELRV
jgi:hypothetical protein